MLFQDYGTFPLLDSFTVPGDKFANINMNQCLVGHLFLIDQIIQLSSN